MPAAHVRRCSRHPWEVDGPHGCALCHAILARKKRLDEACTDGSPIGAEEQAASVGRMLDSSGAAAAP